MSQTTTANVQRYMELTRDMIALEVERDLLQETLSLDECLAIEQQLKEEAQGQIRHAEALEKFGISMNEKGLLAKEPSES